MQDTLNGPYRLIQDAGDHIIAEVLEVLGAVPRWPGLSGGAPAGADLRRQGRTADRGPHHRYSDHPVTEVWGGQLTRPGDGLSRVSTQINMMPDQITRLLKGQKQIPTDIAHDMRISLQHPYQRLGRISTAQDLSCDDVIANLEQTQDMIATFNALLRTAQLEAGDNNSRFNPVDLGRVLSNVLRFLQSDNQG